MELPQSLLEETINESEIYFFTSQTNVGVPEHIHICVKKQDKYFLFTACTSQTDTIYKFVIHSHIDPNTFPCFVPDETNGFRQITYVNCNQIIEYNKNDFLKLLSDNKIYKLKGKLSVDGMKQIIKGIKLSKIVPERIKKLF